MLLDLIGVPLDLGAGIRGADLGPRGLRETGLVEALARAGHDVNDRGDLEVPSRDVTPVGDPKLRFLEAIVTVTTKLCAMTRESALAGRVPLVFGGDHSYALGSIRGVAKVKRVGVIWVDAHGDFNTTETTPSGNIHGMPLAALAGLGDPRLTGIGGEPRRVVDPENMALIGIRELDEGEALLLERERATVIDMPRVRQGFEAALDHAITVASRGTDGIYLSLDLDGIDPMDAPGVSTAVPGGLSGAQALAICRAVSATGRLVGMDLVELNPLTDRQKMTAKLAVALAEAAAGAA